MLSSLSSQSERAKFTIHWLVYTKEEYTGLVYVFSIQALLRSLSLAF